MFLPKPLTPLIRASLKRRRKEICKILIIGFLAGFFLSGILLYQDCMNNHLCEKNKDVYGDWVYLTDDVSGTLDKYPYLAGSFHANISGSYKPVSDSSIDYPVGYLEDSMIQKGHIKLYEGRFPEKKDEIVMELNMLSKMGYSYDLGQTIILPVTEYTENGNGRTVTKEYQLVGTIKNYTSFWVQGSFLPAALLSESGYKALGLKGTTYTFYYLDKAYERDDFSDAAVAIRDTDQITLFYNSYLYSDTIWGSRELYLTIILVVVTASVSSLLYILLSYLNSRRPEYDRFRSIGATKAQLRNLMWIECALPGLFGVCLGLLSAYVIIAIIMLLLSSTQHIRNGYEVRPLTLLLSVGISVGAVLLSILFSQLSYRARKATASRVLQLSSSNKRSLMHAALREKHCALTLLRRQNQLHRKSVYLARIFNLAICLTFILIISKIGDEYSIYQWMNARNDCELNYIASELVDLHWTEANGDEITNGNYVSTFYKGELPDSTNITSLLGVESVTMDSIDGSHIFNWKDKADHPATLYAEMQGLPNTLLLPEDHLLYGYTIYIFGDTRDTYEKLRRINPDLAISYSAFADGSQVVLGTAYSVDFNPSCANGFSDKSFLNARTIQVETKNSPVTAQVAGVINLNEEEEFPYYLGYPYYNLIASPAFAQKIAAQDKETFHYNMINIFFNSASTYEGTQKWLANYAKSTDATTCACLVEQKDMVRHSFYQKLLLYGSILLIILLLYLVIKINIIQINLRYQKKTYVRLKLLGMSDRYYYHMQRISVLLEFLWCIPALLLLIKYPQTAIPAIAILLLIFLFLYGMTMIESRRQAAQERMN